MLYNFVGGNIIPDRKTKIKLLLKAKIRKTLKYPDKAKKEINDGLRQLSFKDLLFFLGVDFYLILAVIARQVDS